MSDGISIRPLHVDEWERLRDIRLAALKTEPKVFLSGYNDEAGHTPERWQSWLNNPAHCIFGLFRGNDIIGMTSVFTDKSDPSGQTAKLATSFIMPEYRGQGLARTLYEARLQWVAAQPQFKKVIVSHRASNEASRRSNQAWGFKETGRESTTWPDGTVEDDVQYELPVNDLRRQLDLKPKP